MTFDEARAIAHAASVAFSDACDRVAYKPTERNQRKYEASRKVFMDALSASERLSA